MSKIPYVVAHRGIAAHFPENTMVGFQAAVGLGVDWIELDVITTADKVLIVSHDTKADRCTTGTGPFKQMTLEQVKALDAGSKFDTRFTGEQIPTLEELLDLIEPTNICLSIEIKGANAGDFRDTAHAVVRLLQQRNFLRNASIASFDLGCLKAVREWEPRLTTTLDPEPQNGTIAPWELVQQCLTVGANFMGHTYETLTPEIIDEAHRHGLALWTWTVNDEDAIRRIAALDVDAILSDDPALVQSILAG